MDGLFALGAINLGIAIANLLVYAFIFYGDYLEEKRLGPKCEDRLKWKTVWLAFVASFIPLINIYLLLENFIGPLIGLIYEHFIASIERPVFEKRKKSK